MPSKSLASRSVDRSLPKRQYKCPGCDMVKLLHPGRYWHTCGGYEWNMDDVAMAEQASEAVRGALAQLPTPPSPI